jgi:hypothetical protein
MKATSMTIPASAVPEHFHVVHLDLAREPGHPDGSALDRYTLLLPLAADGRIIESEARAHPDDCRVSHASGQADIKRGLIRRDSDGAWIFDFGDAEGEPEVGFRFSQERFSPGEYISIQRGKDQHTYRVVSLQPL